jgi:hypothetical protein
VKYKGEKIELRSGDVVLFRNEFVLTHPKTWLSAAVRFFTKCQYNHCGIIVSSWCTFMINEAKGYGIVTSPANRYLQRNKTKILILRFSPQPSERAICTRANSKLATKYDRSNLVIHQVILRTLGIWIGRTEKAAENKMVCSEYVAWCFELEEWWLYSAAEILKDQRFRIIYQEK